MSSYGWHVLESRPGHYMCVHLMILSWHERVQKEEAVLQKLLTLLSNGLIPLTEIMRRPAEVRHQMSPRP